MSLLRELTYLVFESNELERWEAFATDVLGMSAARRDGSLRLRIDDHLYRFIVRPGASEDLFAAGFSVANREALRALEARLCSHGVAARHGSPSELAEREVEELLCFEDPSGLRLEAVYNPRVSDVPFTSPRMPAGFVTGDRGCGHIAVAAPDLAACEAFYREVLEFRLSDRIVQEILGVPVEVAFFHINARHHTLGLAGVPAPARLHHFMIEVPDLDAVGRALDRVHAAGVPLHMPLGKHPNDKMVSFYSTTPSRFHVEVGTGGLEIRDEDNWQVVTHDRLSEWGHGLRP